MVGTDNVFAGSIPDIYDEYLVPLIFETFATDMASRVAALNPAAVLETAAGSGVVTRALAPRLLQTTEYAVTDLNPPMLERAKRQQPADNRIEWRRADALDLPFREDAFDVICCQFGVMFFPDKVTGYRSARRSLRKDGHLIFSVWDRIADNEFADSVTKTASTFFPDDPPVFLARTPHGYHNVKQIDADLRAAGFENIEIDTLTEESRADSARIPAVAYCQGTPLRNELEAREASLIDEITDKAAEEIERKFGAGQVTGVIKGHVVTARK